MQATAEMNPARSAGTACRTGQETGPGSVPAEADNVQLGQWVTGFVGAPVPSGAAPLSGVVQIAKKALE